MDKLVHREGKSWQLKEEVRRFSLNQLCRTWTSELGKSAATRLAEAVAQLHPITGHGIAQPLGRLLVGQGRAAATETSIVFHPIWGVPLIPGSALKGIARAELATELSALEVDKICGTTDRVGLITFYDAIPSEGEFTLALDGQTPHHGKYYGTEGADGDEDHRGRGRDDGPQSTAPTDADSPVPFSFLTVVKTVFAIHLGAREVGAVAEAAMDKAWSALTTALEDLGVGGKTSAGYGRFRLPHRSPTSGER